MGEIIRFAAELIFVSGVRFACQLLVRRTLSQVAGGRNCLNQWTIMSRGLSGECSPARQIEQLRQPNYSELLLVCVCLLQHDTKESFVSEINR